MTVPKLLLGPYVLGWWRKVLDKEQGTEEAKQEAGEQFLLAAEGKEVILIFPLAPSKNCPSVSYTQCPMPL